MSDAANTPTPPAAPAPATGDLTDEVREQPTMPLEMPLASAEERESLEQLRKFLLVVHRGLLQAERTRYEKVRGRIDNNSAFLQLVINDPFFDWLRPMAQLVLLIDERSTDKKSPMGSAEARSLYDRGRALLRADAEGDAFQRLYFQALQHSPDLAVLTRQVAGALSR
ncbi:MAG: hypothetical protein K2Y26_19060 [Gemmatimonadaceae bacterium]|nr:hypothetical protein [Gemmatimonadaceae bacterium]